MMGRLGLLLDMCPWIDTTFIVFRSFVTRASAELNVIRLSE